MSGESKPWATSTKTDAAEFATDLDLKKKI
jgi:hypothetical protein